MKRSQDQWWFQKRRVTPEEFLRLLPIIFLFPIAACLISTFIQPSRTLDSLIGRGGRVIALEENNNTEDRLVITEPIEHPLSNNTVEKRPAIATYQQTINEQSYFTNNVITELTEAQWQTLLLWKTEICKNRNSPTVEATRLATYRVSLQCGNLSYGRTFYIQQSELPNEVREIIRILSKGALT